MDGAEDTGQEVARMMVAMAHVTWGSEAQLS